MLYVAWSAFLLDLCAWRHEPSVVPRAGDEWDLANEAPVLQECLERIGDKAPLAAVLSQEIKKPQEMLTI